MIGPSGCGKSTLIRLLAGFEKPTSGTLTLNGEPIHGPGARPPGAVPGDGVVSVDDHVGQHSVRPARARRAHPRNPRIAEFLLNKVGLQDFRKKYPTQLSGGMQRRAELARAMINNPEVMILDEPFRGLDAMTKELMWEYYSALYEEKRRTNFFVTTDIDEAIFLADRLLIMSNIPTQVRAVHRDRLAAPAQAARSDRERPRQRDQDAGAVDPAQGGDEVVLARQQGRGRFRRGVFETHQQSIAPCGKSLADAGGRRGEANSGPLPEKVQR